MMKERQEPYRAPHAEHGERVIRLKSWLEVRGIKAVLFDFDDTLLATSDFVERHKTGYKDYLAAKLPHIDRIDVERAVEKADIDVYATHSVGRTRWDGAIQLVAASFPDVDPGIFTAGAPLLHAMYVTPPDLHPGAYETVQTFRAAVPNLGMVTHADSDWTQIKLAHAGLNGVFDHVEIVDQYKSKEAADWTRAIEALGVEPAEVLVIGDSITGDVQASRNAGVIYIVALPSPWEVYRRGHLPEGVIQAGAIDMVIDTLLQVSKG